MQEASGEAVGSCNSTHKNVVCPTCGRSDFKSRRGMKCHHSKAHGESLSVGVYECDYCGCEFKRQKTAAQGGKTGLYCSRSCSAKATTKKGKGHPNYNSVIVECESCGSDIERIKARVERTETHYCDNECRTLKETVECDNCGCETIKHKKSIKRSENLFCSPECHDEYRRNGYEFYYGRCWTEQRRKAIIEYQARCQICGKCPTDLGKEPDVHHIVPMAKFKERFDEPECYQRANRVSNLVVLCQKHHRKWEGIPVKPLLA